jgi:hypothetical protein
VEPRRIDLEALLNAHAFMPVERPPVLWRWTPASREPLWGRDLDAAARAASAVFAYLRRLGPDEGSTTVFIPRSLGTGK